MNVSAAIANPLLRRASAGWLAPRTLTVLHEYASGLTAPRADLATRLSDFATNLIVSNRPSREHGLVVVYL